MNWIVYILAAVLWTVVTCEVAFRSGFRKGEAVGLFLGVKSKSKWKRR